MRESERVRSQLEDRVSTLAREQQELFQAGKGFGLGVAFQALSEMSDDTSIRDAAQAIFSLAKLEVME